MATGAHESVFNDVRDWLLAGKRVWLCTITETWGSSPRPAGSWLAVSSDGDWSGSVSGGCLEEDLLNRCVAGGFEFRGIIPSKTPAEIAISVVADLIAVRHHLRVARPSL